MPDGKSLATACRDGVVRVWDTTAINPIVRSQITGPAGGVRLLLAPDAGTLVGVNDGTRVLNWELRGGKVLVEGLVDDQVRTLSIRCPPLDQRIC